MTAQELTDTELGRAIQASNYMLAKYICNGRKRPDLVEDIQQDIYMIALSDVRIDQDMPLAFTIIKRALLDRIKSRVYNYSYENKVEHFHIEGNPDSLLCHIDNSPLPDDLASLAYDQALACLDNRSAGIFNMLFRDDMDQAEVAEKLGCSPSLVNKILWRGIKKIRRKWGIADDKIHP